MGSRVFVQILGVAVASAGMVLAQETPLPKNAISVNLPKDSPVKFLGLDPLQSRISPRGGAIIVELDALLTLRNTSSNRIHGITLRVVSQETATGGKAWMSLPRLNVGPDELVAVHLMQKLVRPSGMGGGTLVEVSLDGVLFQDLSFYGPDQLHSRRDMIAWEMEAQRDRTYFKGVLARAGRDGLQQTILQEMARMADRPQLDRPQFRRGAAVASAAVGEHSEKFAFVQFPDAPVEALSGSAQVAGAEVSTPHIEVRNRSTIPVKHVEIGWLVEDQTGRQYLAASVPSPQDDLGLAAGKTAAISQDTSMKLSRNSQPVLVRAMRGFVSQVEFANGKVWVPSRQNLDDAALRNALPPSAELLRLTDIYGKKGIDALIAELNKP